MSVYAIYRADQQLERMMETKKGALKNVSKRLISTIAILIITNIKLTSL
jgi:hypothetical protein